MKTAFLYSEKFGSFYYGNDHPMRPVRLKLTYELISELGLLKLPRACLVEARPSNNGELALFHTPAYIKVLKEANTGIIPVGGPDHGLGFEDNPVFSGVFEWSSYCAGATLQACELVASAESDIAFNISGGLHHAMPNRASGFCYINDAAVGIKHLASLGKRVAYIDIDAHHGDGVEYAFYDTNQVLTVSIHESGHWLFPGTGFASDTGVGVGTGYSINLPMPPNTSDDLYLKSFEEVVPPFIEAFDPDIIVTQLGVDSFETDPITHLNLTTNSFEKIVERFRSFNKPWVALGGGGYDLSNVARGWTLAWAIMNQAETPVSLPKDFLERNGSIFKSQFLRDKPIVPFRQRHEEMRRLEEDIRYLKKEVLPMVKKG